MKLAVITPPEFLNEVHIARLSYHMALGQELLRNVAYCDWYRWRHAHGDFITVDNGAAEPGEERLPFDSVLEAAEYVHADEVILPDVLFEGDQTVQLTTNKFVCASVPTRYRMIVPQGRSQEEWIECFQEIAKRIDFRTIGIAKHLEASVEGGRGTLIRWLHSCLWTEKVDIHLLGIYGSPRPEIQRINASWRGVRGIDSAAPIAYAQQGVSLLDDVEKCSLDWTKTADRKLVVENIRTLQGICSAGEMSYAPKGE